MIFTPRMQKAIRFMVKTHEVYQKQKRKGKDIPYLIHPFTAGLILARAGASEDIIIAGILHDTLEDSVEHKKVTKEMLVERFGSAVADLVESVSETDKALSWEERKRDALDHIQTFSLDSVLLKSADVISNNMELLDDYAEHGEVTFERFGAGKERVIEQTLSVIEALQAKWPESPLAPDLSHLAKHLKELAI